MEIRSFSGEDNNKSHYSGCGCNTLLFMAENSAVQRSSLTLDLMRCGRFPVKGEPFITLLRLQESITSAPCLNYRDVCNTDLAKSQQL